jgi:RNA polymerase sigma-70 factor, ECF subfamily
LNVHDPRQEPSEITLLLRQAGSGDTGALYRVYPLVYGELKRLAASRLRSERSGHTLNPTALVHEAYLRLAAQTETEWRSRAHFFAVAAEAMRRILVDHARRRLAAKRGAGARQVPLEAADESATPFSSPGADAEWLIALDEALVRLGEFNPRGARVVECRFFGGMGFREISEVLGLSEVTARRSWTITKGWLRRELGGFAVPGDVG